MSSTNFTVAPRQARHPAPEHGRSLFTRRSSRSGPGRPATPTQPTRLSFFTIASTCRATTPTTVTGSENRKLPGAFNYNGDLYGVKVSHLTVGDDFVPEVGFVRRDDMRRSTDRPLQPRPRRQPAGSPVRVEGVVYLRRERRRPPRLTRRLAGFGIELQQRTPWKFRDRRVRAAAGAVRDRARRPGPSAATTRKPQARAHDRRPQRGHRHASSPTGAVSRRQTAFG